MQALGAFGLAAVELAQGEAIALDVMDDARRGDGRGGVHDAADEAAGVDLLGQDAGRVERLQSLVVVLAAQLLEIPPRQPVLHRHDHGIGAEQGVDVARGLIEIMRLDREDDEVLLAGVGRLVDRLDLRGLHLAVVPFELEAVLLDGGEMHAEIDHGHRIAG